MTKMLDRLQGPDPAQPPPAPTIAAMASRLETRSDWLRANPPAPERLTQTLALLAERLRDGEGLRHALGEFLDEYSLRNDDASRSAAISERPPQTEERHYEALLGALAEHLATIHSLERPQWSVEPGRFLERFWFLSEVPGFRASAIAQAPAAFRRRGIFIPERSLHRV